MGNCWPCCARLSQKGNWNSLDSWPILPSLLDSMRGDPTLFTRRDEVEAEWTIITPIEEAWKQLPAPAFPNYSAGSEGPAAADALIGGGQRAWHKLAV